MTPQSRISQQQLESYLWGAATLLRGTIDAGDYKQFIFPLLFFKRLCDVFDEETQAALKESGGDAAFAAYPENHRFQIPQDAHWREARKAAKNVGQALQSAMRAIETANPEKLYGIFGDAQWTNKDRLSDAMLRDLIEHFSTLELTVANLPEDELGQGYEYLIKKFADDSGHTAAEFYTNRTVVHLMTELLDVQPGESVYDPTCGSGGMLLSCIAHLRRQGKEWRNVRLYGQERNLMTSSIARMNCFLHGIEDFRIERGDTLSDPKFIQGDHLQRFDVALANPPYSIKQWDREAFASDPWGRNLYGTPPQGRADYAFWQHILCSLAPPSPPGRGTKGEGVGATKTSGGRCAILFPHGVLFRQEEADMRRKLIEADLVECVIGLGPNLFYNAAMEACVVICRAAKPKARKGKILLINAVNEVTRERAQSLLTNDHIQRIVKAYEHFKDEPGFAHIGTREEIRANNANLNMPLYVAVAPNGSPAQSGTQSHVSDSIDEWLRSSTALSASLGQFLPPSRGQNSQHKLNPQCARLPLFDRKGWTRVRFGDVVRQLKEQTNPVADGVERYVAGEHMETENVHIRKWGNVGDGYLGPAFIRCFRRGQVLYGSRRTYLKKVALAEWDGVTANTTFVLEAVEGKLLQGLLPWLMLSERFTKHSVQESKGSTNPYINFPDIAKFEFDLPPLDQQRRIAALLWALDEVITNTETTEQSAQALAEAELDEFLYNRRNWPVAECRNLLPDGPKNGYSLPSTAEPSGLPTLSIRAIRDGKVIPEGSLKYANVTEDEVAQFKLHAKDILVVRGNGNRMLCGRAGIVDSTPPGCFYPDLLIRLRFREDSLLPEFAVLQWNDRKAHMRLLSKAKSTNGIWKINGKDIQSHTLVVPPVTEQRRFLDRRSQTAKLATAIRASRCSAAALQTALLNTSFS